MLTVEKKRGRPTTWASQEPTTHIRVPRSLAKTISEMARQADEIRLQDEVPVLVATSQLQERVQVVESDFTPAEPKTLEELIKEAIANIQLQAPQTPQTYWEPVEIEIEEITDIDLQFDDYVDIALDESKLPPISENEADWEDEEGYLRPEFMPLQELDEWIDECYGEIWQRNVDKGETNDVTALPNPFSLTTRVEKVFFVHAMNVIHVAANRRCEQEYLVELAQQKAEQARHEAVAKTLLSGTGKKSGSKSGKKINSNKGFGGCKKQ